MNDVFLVLMLGKYITDPNYVISYEYLQIQEDSTCGITVGSEKNHRKQSKIYRSATHTCSRELTTLCHSDG